MKYLQGKGYRVIPVNPGTAGKELLGEKVYASLRDIPGTGRHGRCFPRLRPGRPPIVDDAIAIGAKVVWMQLGVRNDEAAARAEAAGHRSGHEPLPEDRIRPAGRRAVVERRQLRHHPQPRARSRRPSAGAETAAAAGRPMSATGSRRARSMPAPRPIPRPARASRRSIQTTAYVFDDVDHAASLFNLHNFGYIYSRLTNPDRRRCWRSASPAWKAGAPPSPPRRATPRSSWSSPP